MTTVSWYAELALRMRVSMSAIGSVIVMRGLCLSSPRFPRACGEVHGLVWRFRAGLGDGVTSWTW